MESRLTLYSPHAVQLKFHQSNARYRVAILGRQAGKSTMCANEMLKRAWENPATTYWFMSPIHSQAKEQYRRLVRAIPPGAIEKTLDTELRVQLLNQSIIQYCSGESLHHLRGPALNGVVIDEVRDQHPDLWPIIIRPMLATTKGWAAFVSTPNGFDSFYDLVQKAKDSDDGTWESFHSPSTCNPLFTTEEFEQARKEMSESQFRQEILAEFVNLTQGSVYVSYSEKNHATQCPWAAGLWHPLLPIHVYMDFNVDPMCWVLGQYRPGTGHYFFDEIVLRRSHTPEAAEELAQRLNAIKAQGHKAEVTCVLVGDATGKATKTSSAGKTDYTLIHEVLRRHGIKYEDRTPDSNPLVKDRVNTMNTRLKAADGSVHLWLHPISCKMLKRDFERVCWKEGSNAIIDKTTDLDLTHSSDSVGYGVCVTNPIQAMGQIGVARVNYRF